MTRRGERRKTVRRAEVVEKWRAPEGFIFREEEGRRVFDSQKKKEKERDGETGKEMGGK